jgi:hypothetical protein
VSNITIAKNCGNTLGASRSAFSADFVSFKGNDRRDARAGISCSGISPLCNFEEPVGSNFLRHFQPLEL